MSSRLPNYLRTYRKRAGFTQEEMSFLLGCRSGAKVSRYEHFIMKPGLKTALAWEIIFRIPLREILSGMFEEVEEKTVKQAELLIKKLEIHPDPATAKKLKFLKSITGPKLLRKNP
jgi:transcriptional regulator with XRE-family HTH domain